MAPLHSIGIISIGEMGLGIAQLLISRKYRVLTYAGDRSETTQQRARAAGVELLPSIRDLIAESEIILSIVPPRNAITTAQRILDGVASNPPREKNALYFVDLNAVSPAASRQIASLFSGKEKDVLLIDGAIIGNPPHRILQSGTNSRVGEEAAQETGEREEEEEEVWECPNIVISGPKPFPDLGLAETLNVQHISDEIGAATGLKMCFAALTKGFTALAIQSFTTAHTLGVLPELRELLQGVTPATLKRAESGLVAMPPKAYRWVHEMREIGRTMEDEGGFSDNLFNGVADVYETVAERSVLGAEKPGDRKLGLTVEEVTSILGESLKVKTD